MGQNWIVLGTYKTRPENEGWYVHPSYKYIFWDILNNSLNTNFGTKDTYFDSEKGYGQVKGAENIIFYDLLRNADNSDNNGNKLIDSSKDEDLFPNQTIRNRMVDRLDKLFYDVVPNLETCHIGCIGFNTFGLVKTYLNHGKGFILNDYDLKNICSKEDYGEKTNLSKPKNAKIYLLFNITAKAAVDPKNYDRIYSSWNCFWDNE